MRVRFFSLGCRVNQVDAQALRGLFAREGFEPVEQGDAEVLVVNSCTVTSMADRKTRQLVRRLRREQPAADLSHPAMAVQLDACIQCNRCVRACREEQVNDVIGS
ncbi:MAG: hypothetical protein RR320_01365, partial [Oscillospiraceae bacterium]